MALWTLTAGSEDSGTEWGNALNQYFQEVAQKSSGAAAPTDTRAFMWWMDTTTNTLKMRDSADAAWIEWVYIDPATNEMSWVGPVRVLQNADTITVSHDGTDAYLQWTDGSLIIQTDEGTNTDTLFEVKGKGTGKGKLVLWDQSATNKTTFQTADAQGVDITYTLPTSDGSANQVLSTDGAGVLSWATAAGGGVSVPVRQTVVQGATDANGRANFLSAGAGLTLNIDGTSPSLIVVAAMGFDSDGAVDRVGVQSSDTTLSMPDNSTSYVYATVDTDNTVSFASTTLAPAYQYTAPGTPASGQRWFDLSTWKMQSYDGAAWQDSYDVFLGQAVTAAGAITTVITYALNGQYVGPWTAWSASNNYSIAHYLGVPPEMQIVTVRWSQNSDGSSPYTVDGEDASGGTRYGYRFRGWSATAGLLFTEGNLWAESGTTQITSGYFQVSIRRAF